MTSIYEQHGIRFLYPENWTLDESEDVAEQNSVTVYSPEGAFWNVVWRDVSEDPQALAQEALDILKQEYPETEWEPVTEELAGHTIEGFDVSFYYLDLINTAIIRGFRSLEASYMVLYQAEDRELRKIEPIFQAITASLLQSM